MPHIDPPAPLEARAAVPPARAAQSVAAALVQQGFTISLADASGGIVQAHREWQTTIDTAFVRCVWAHPKTAINTTMRVSLVARPDTAGSRLTIRADVVALVGADAVFRPNQPGEPGYCVSTGAIEQRLLAAAQGG